MATIPADMIKVAFVFDLYEPGVAVEQGVFGFHGHREHFAGNSVDWGADVQELADKMHDKFMTGVPTLPFSPAVVMNRVDVYHLSTANKTLDKGSAAFDPVSEWSGSAQRGMPWEVATVVSLYGYNPGSFTQNPRNKRGRFYLPPISQGLTDALSGMLTPDAQTSTLEWLQDWLNDVQGTEIGTAGGELNTDYFDLGILSTQRKNTPGYDGTFTPATFIRLGRVLDVQRRRRRSQEERYQTLPIAHS